MTRWTRKPYQPPPDKDHWLILRDGKVVGFCKLDGWGRSVWRWHVNTDPQRNGLNDPFGYEPSLEQACQKVREVLGNKPVRKL